jgi:hypothetical protein
MAYAVLVASGSTSSCQGVLTALLMLSSLMMKSGLNHQPGWMDGGQEVHGRRQGRVSVSSCVAVCCHTPGPGGSVLPPGHQQQQPEGQPVSASQRQQAPTSTALLRTPCQCMHTHHAPSFLASSSSTCGGITRLS